MSDLADRVETLLKLVLPTHRCIKEKYVLYQHTRLFFDFFYPELNLFIEVQGQQHYTFNKFYHADRSKLTEQTYRDSLKTQYTDERGYKLLVLSYKEIELLSVAKLKSLILGKL